MGLEVGNASDCQVDVVTPAGNDWVWVDTSVAVLVEEAEEGLPHGVLEGPSPHRESLYDRIADEGVGIRGRIAASRAGLIPSPETGSGYPTGLAYMPGLLPEGDVNFAERHSNDLCTSAIGRSVLKSMRESGPVRSKEKVCH